MGADVLTLATFVSATDDCEGVALGEMVMCAWCGLCICLMGCY